MRCLFLLIFFTVVSDVFCCYKDDIYIESFAQHENNYLKQKVDRCRLFFEKEIVIKNNTEPYLYSNTLKNEFEKYDINRNYTLTAQSVFEELYLSDSKAVAYGAFIKEARFSKNAAKNICTKIDSKLYLITDVVPKNFTYLQGEVIRIKGKNFCKKIFDSEMGKVELTKFITDGEIETYFKDLFNPFEYGDIFVETFNKSKQKIKMLLCCFKQLNDQKKIRMHKNLIMNYFIPSILKERFEGKFKEVNTAFTTFIDQYNAEQEKVYIKAPMNSVIQRFFLSGTSIESFNENIRTAFIAFVKKNK